MAEDMNDVLSLIKELAEFEHGLSEVTVTVEDLLRDGFGEKPLYKCLIAEDKEGIAGAAIYFYSYSTWKGKCLYLEDIIVKEAKRSGGIGHRLMNELIGIGKKEGVKRLSWQVLDWNVDAHRFYKKFDASLDAAWLNGRLTEGQIKEFKDA